ncbi:hypothetical protein [Deinococcus fonticola]|uniref:hypothetical protein n=1 Tax=Deinococcus fonticola TaxID=2528713 RepID=UPI001F0F1380|nr:hypothetical protein [Deinococcus fonticola]
MRRPSFPPDPLEETPSGTVQGGTAQGGTVQGSQERTGLAEATGVAEETARADDPVSGEAARPTPDTGHALTDWPGVRGTWAGRWRTLSRLPVTLMIASVLLGLGIVQLTFHLGHTVYRSFTWLQDTRQTSARVQALQRDVNMLHDAEKAASDPAYLEQLARCQGFVGQKEQVIVAPNAPTTPSENCQVIRLP